MALALAALSALFGCTDRPATQILLHIHSDMVEGTELQSVEVTASYEGALEQPVVPTTRRDLTRGEFGLPGEISIVPREPDEPRRLFVTVTGHSTAGDVVQLGRVRFEEGRKLLAFFYLTRLCRARVCAEGQTCGNDGRCRPIDQVTFLEIGTRDSATDQPATDQESDVVRDAVFTGDVDASAANPFPSTGAEGAFPPPDAGMNLGDVRVVPLAPGVHHFTTISVPLDMRVVTTGEGTLDLRATGPVLIQGTIDVSGGMAERAAGCTGCGASPTPAALTGMGGSGGSGVAGRPSGSGSPGGRFGGGSSGFGLPNGGFESGGGGGGYCGGGGGGVMGLFAGGNGASFPEMGTLEEGGVGGTAMNPAGGGGCAMSRDLAVVYRGGPGMTTAAPCMYAAVGGGGGGSIGLAAANDLPVRTLLRSGSGGGAGALAQMFANGTASGSGGGGGGVLRIATPASIFVGRNGELLAAGGAGGQSINTRDGAAGAGGGGSGGVIYLASPSIRVLGRVSVQGGAGGRPFMGTATPSCGAAGGAGGLGRLRLSVLPDPAHCDLAMATITPPLPDAGVDAGCALSPDGGVAGQAFVARWPE